MFAICIFFGEVFVQLFCSYFFLFFFCSFFLLVIYFLIELESSLYILHPSLWLEIRFENIFFSLWLVLNFGFVVLGFTFRFIVHFELAFPCGVRIHVFFLAYGYPVVQSVFVEKTILSPLSCPCTFCLKSVAPRVWVCFVLFSSIGLFILTSVPHWTGYPNTVSLKSGSLVKAVLAILDLLYFHMEI